MVEECVCGHYRADHELNADCCKRCPCVKFRLGRLVDVQGQLKAVQIECEGIGKPIGYDRTYALAQKVLAIIRKETG